MAFLVLGLAAPAAALDPNRALGDYMVDFWQEDSGLPQKYVRVILQTRDGYLWVGTRGGLARFDGVRFTTFDDRHPDQLPESEIASLAEGADGSLWIGTHGGGLSHLKDGRFTTYTTEDGLPNNFVSALAGAPDGGVWIGTEKGLAILKDERFHAYGPREGSTGHAVQSLYRDHAGVLWIGTTGGLARLAGGQIVDAIEGRSDLDSPVFRISGDAQGTLWAGTHGSGVLRLDHGVATRFGGHEGIDGIITSICVDTQGTPWVGTVQGLFRYRAGRFERYASTGKKVGGNQTRQSATLRKVQAVFADREGSVWAGTSMDGLARLRDAAFTTVSIGEKDGVEERVSAVFEDSRGAIWLAADSGAMARWQGDTFDTFKTTSDSNVDTITEDNEGVIWVGNEGGILRFKSGKFGKVSAADGLDRISVSVTEQNGRMWLGSRSTGLYSYHQGQITHYTPAEGMPGTQVRALALDPKGGLWVGTKDGGLARLFQGHFKTVTVADGLASASVSAIHVDRAGVVWVATRRGLCRIQNGKVASYIAKHGLPTNFFYQIVEDDLDHLWLTHGRGITRVAKQDLDDVAAGKAHTLPHRDFGTESGIRSTSMVVPNQPAAWKSRDGRLWFATGRGAAVVDPATLSRNPVVPPVWVEEIRVDRQAHPLRAESAFPPGDGDVAIEYTALSFLAPERVLFKYKLEGFDAEWVEAGARRVAYYTNLPPGRYRFHVRACNNDGVWNDAGHSLAFRLRPHWYQTQWFHASIAGLVGLSLVGAYRWRIRAHMHRERDLARRVEEALAHVKQLRGLVPICASCKKIRDDQGYWNEMETYIQERSDADFSHGVCPDCITSLYPDYAASRDTGDTTRKS